MGGEGWTRARSQRRTSIREVALRAGVAISSVSRVLSGHPDVSTEMRERVLSAVDDLHYRPDFLAQSLRRGATMSVGFVVSDISNPLMAEITAGAEAVLRRAGYSLVVMNSESQATLDAEHIRFFESRRVDGIILASASEDDPATLESLAHFPGPFVVVDRDMPASAGASAVLSDHAAGMSQAVDHLLELGHRRIALITGSLAIRPGHARLAALRAALAANDGAEASVAVGGSFTPGSGELALDELLDRPQPPTAIIIGGNQLLVGCLRGFHRRGLRVGADVSLVTCDDVPLVELYRPALASISRDSVALGRTAAELLVARLNGQTEPEIVVLPTHFVRRDSCAPPSTMDVDRDEEATTPSAAHRRRRPSGR